MTLEYEEAILTIACPDRMGIVAAVAGFLAARHCFLIESSHFGDPEARHFFMRTRFCASTNLSLPELKKDFESIAQAFEMEAQFHDAQRKTKTLIMVSQQDHCLNDLLYRMRDGSLAIDVPLVVSNHESLHDLVEWYGIRFVHLPVTPETRAESEAKLLGLLTEYDIEFVVLARYMQILSPELASQLYGRVMNIHHSFLPSFKGARPYAQAYARGVKLIGATAHYVTSSLDEGPIIEQDVERVRHDHDLDHFIAVGRDIERLVLARAVRAHVEHRVLLNGPKTVVFS